MKKTLIAFSFSLAVHAFSAPVSAAVSCSVNSCTGPINDMIDSILPSPGGSVNFASRTIIAALPCIGSNNGRFPNVLLPATHGTFEETYALALYASSINATVTVRATNESVADGTTCMIHYIRLHL